MVIIEKQKGYIDYLTELEAGTKIEFPAHKGKSIRPVISLIKKDVRYHGRDFRTKIVGESLVVERIK